MAAFTLKRPVAGKMSVMGMFQQASALDCRASRIIPSAFHSLGKYRVVNNRDAIIGRPRFCSFPTKVFVAPNSVKLDYVSEESFSGSKPQRSKGCLEVLSHLRMFSVMNSPMLRRSLSLKLWHHEHQELPMSMYARMIFISVCAGNAAVLHGFIKTPQHTAVPLRG
jgi:hypothetical protein